MVTWEDLNECQQAYLTVIFNLDQAKKADHDDYPRRNYGYDRRSASQWQQISYEELLQEVRPKCEDVEQILARFVREGLIEREEQDGLAQDHPRIRITPAGRKMVRDALGITRVQFTPAQRGLIDRIVSAGLTSQAEAEAAFRDNKGGRAQIEDWKRMLKNRASAAFAERLAGEHAYLASLTRWEPCAYPGCLVRIEVRTLAIGGRANGNEEEPKPVRFMELVEQLPGWHDERRGDIKVRVPNTRTTELHLYACSPAHQEGIYRLAGQITLSLDQAEERRLQSIIYPWASEEARRSIWLQGASDALDYVAQAPLGAPLPSPRAWVQINTIGQSCLSVFKASTMAALANTGKQFTDDEAALTKRYLEMFRLEFRSGMNIREAILVPKPGPFHTSFRNDPRWQQLYSLVEHSQGSPEKC